MVIQNNKHKWFIIMEQPHVFRLLLLRIFTGWRFQTYFSYEFLQVGDFKPDSENFEFIKKLAQIFKFLTNYLFIYLCHLGTTLLKSYWRSWFRLLLSYLHPYQIFSWFFSSSFIARFFVFWILYHSLWSTNHMVVKEDDSILACFFIFLINVL
jgi:hypothetical protein